MTNAFVNGVETVGKDVGHGLEVAGKDVVKVITFLPKLGDKVVKLIESGKELTPEVKAAIAKVLNDADTLAAEAATAESAKGLNIGADESVVSYFTIMVKDVIALKPLVEEVISDVKADIA